jgi:hypothetical protein
MMAATRMPRIKIGWLGLAASGPYAIGGLKTL